MMLEGRTILVCGASRGLGKAVCERVLDEGANLCQVSRNIAELRANTEGWTQRYRAQSIKSLALDLRARSSPGKLSAFLENQEALDGLVVTVGNGKPRNGDLVTNLRKSLDINLFSVVHSFFGAQPFIREDSNSSVVVVGSIAGHEVIDCPPEYATSKAALEMLIKHWSKLYSPVRFNTVAPGNIQTEGSVWQRRMRDEPLKLRNELKVAVPLGRLAEPEEVAHVIGFLLSPRSSFMTGSSVTVDGGQQRSLR